MGAELLQAPRTLHVALSSPKQVHANLCVSETQTCLPGNLRTCFGPIFGVLKASAKLPSLTERAVVRVSHCQVEGADTGQCEPLLGRVSCCQAE